MLNLLYYLSTTTACSGIYYAIASRIDVIHTTRTVITCHISYCYKEVKYYTYHTLGGFCSGRSDDDTIPDFSVEAQYLTRRESSRALVRDIIYECRPQRFEHARPTKHDDDGRWVSAMVRCWIEFLELLRKMLKIRLRAALQNAAFVVDRFKDLNVQKKRKSSITVCYSKLSKSLRRVAYCHMSRAFA